ncbi:uncharacterized protein LOC115223020 isoform X1 [Octopus sinensis]|uniref:Uncharacterized protein LOC115223020 isoform X1 n=1 Tax=Octopus sinensis TaxID=2607531 RepID=A0A6P7THQ3_9MOLL|nr:uncharacterized protein LOC115223020 isoform X1 [Octopus sinensis]XP_036367869.1 uncharacterized protein LOC115223020 isoform X1 [Octopus sinensis]
MAYYKNAESTQSDEELYPNIPGYATDTNFYPNLSEDKRERFPSPVRRSERLKKSYEDSLKHSSDRRRNVGRNEDIINRKNAQSNEELYPNSPGKLYPNLSEGKNEQSQSERFPKYNSERQRRPNIGGNEGIRNKNIRNNINTVCFQSRESAEPHKNNSMWIFGLITLILLSLGMLLGLSKGGQKEDVTNINFGNLKGKFRTQSNRVWAILKASTNHIIAAEEPDRPAVIMMVLPNKEYQLMALCLAQHLSHDLNKILKGQPTAAVSYPFVNGTNFINYEISDQKLKLDNSIQDIIKQWKSVIITNLEKFHSQTVMLFHGLCDTTEAEHKRIAIIFLLESPYAIKSEEELALYLESLWSDMNRIKIKPLLSRIANNVIFLNQDKSFTNCL